MDHKKSSVKDKGEKALADLLKKESNPHKIFKKIKKRLPAYQVSGFLYNSGLDKTLLEFSIQRLKQGKSPAWPFLIQLFIKYRLPVSKGLAKILFHHWLKHKKNQSRGLFACQDWEDLSPEFQQLRFVTIKELQEQVSSPERELLDRLEWANAKKLLNEKEEIIEKLLSIHPSNAKYKKLKASLLEEKALLVIERERDSEKLQSQHLIPKSKEELALKKHWFEMVSQLAHKDPKQAKNLSLFLYFCAWPDHSLQLMETYREKLSDYWFCLNWIFETKEYLKGLEMVNYLLQDSQIASASLLPLIYLKSQLLEAVGKTSEAVDLLSAVVQVRPDYKSAKYLLDKWMKK